jgi:hypothetical protein
MEVIDLLHGPLLSPGERTPPPRPHNIERCVGSSACEANIRDSTLSTQHKGSWDSGGLHA